MRAGRRELGVHRDEWMAVASFLGASNPVGRVG